MDNSASKAPYETSAFETVLAGEAQRLLHQHSANVLARYGNLLPELDALNKAILSSKHSMSAVVKSSRNKLRPSWSSFDLTGNSGLEDLSLFKFLHRVGGSVVDFIIQSQLRLQTIERSAGILLPVLTGEKEIELTKLVLAEESGSILMEAVRQEYVGTILQFEKLLASVYLTTRNEYKKLRKKFVGGNAAPTPDDMVEDQLMFSLFGSKPPQTKSDDPPIELMDDNCVFTQLLVELSGNLPKFYEKVTPILKRGKPTGNTQVTKTLDPGEIEDYAETMQSVSDKIHWSYVNDPNKLTKEVLAAVVDFQYVYADVSKALYDLVKRADLGDDHDRARIIEDPTALVKQYSRINFLSIRPSAEDIAPRTKMDRDVSIARSKLFMHLKETLTALSGMTRYMTTTEAYAKLRVNEAIELKDEMDDILKTEEQKNLTRNIHDENEFYVGKSGNVGALLVEREPAPKITYESVVGESFIKAKEHIEEVVKVASNPHIMRLSAPRGDVRSNLLMIGPFGCHRKGQKLLMYDGTTKQVEDIIVGDLLMGPDSTPRTVQTLVYGKEPMVEIIPTKGDSWVVNRSHLLTLKNTQKRTKKNGIKTYEKISEILDVPVSEYLTWSANKKMPHVLFRVPVDFQSNETFQIQPYFLGALLGDGGLSGSTNITTMDAEIKTEAYAQAATFGLGISVSGAARTAPSYYFSAERRCDFNPLRQILREMDLFNCNSATKFIPHVYKIASREQRLQLLAGLMDTDGSLHGDCCYDYISKSKTLANDVAFVARSLGFAAYVRPCKKKSQNGAEGDYFRVGISGHVDSIPVRIPHKKAAARKQIKNVLHVGFKTKELPAEDFYGFKVDADNRYLLDDFTVTHNCGKSEMAKAVGADKRIIGFSCSVADLLTAYMHESVKNVKRMYDHAKDLRRNSRHTKPVGLIVDEFDRLFSYGEGVHAAYDGDRMTGALQEVMDGVVGYEGVFMVALTNVPKNVPKAVLRRFKYVDVVGQLTTAERSKLFKQFLTKGLPIDESVTDDHYTEWANLLNHAPGDVIGKVADEIHFKFMHELSVTRPEKLRSVEKLLAKRLRDREAKPADYVYLKKALGSYKTISGQDIKAALDETLKQPQVTMQIEAAKQVYKDADDILKGLTVVGETGLGFSGTVGKRSKLWV